MMSFFNNNCRVKFIIPVANHNLIRLAHIPTGEVHKKQWGSEISTEAQNIVNKGNQYDPAFSGDLSDTAGYLVFQNEEFERLTTALTPIGKGCRITFIGGSIVRYRVREIRPIGHIDLFSDDPDGLSEASLQAVYYDQDVEEIAGRN